MLPAASSQAERRSRPHSNGLLCCQAGTRGPKWKSLGLVRGSGADDWAAMSQQAGCLSRLTVSDSAEVRRSCRRLRRARATVAA